MNAATVVPDACLAWLESFYALPLAERRWVIDFITDQSSTDIGADIAAQLRKMYDLPEVCAVALLDPNPKERAMAATFGAGGPS